MAKGRGIIFGGSVQHYDFALSGIDVAFTQLDRCGDAIAAAKNATPNADTGVGIGNALPASQPAIHEVPLARDRTGTFTLLATLNGTMTLPFLLDTGATDVSLPCDVAARLIAEGSLSRTEYVGHGYTILADGSRHSVGIYTLRSISIGGLTVTDVESTVGDEGSSLLLGQSFLGKFGSWSVDNGRGVLLLGPRRPG